MSRGDQVISIPRETLIKLHIPLSHLLQSKVLFCILTQWDNEMHLQLSPSWEHYWKSFFLTSLKGHEPIHKTFIHRKRKTQESTLPWILCTIPLLWPRRSGCVTSGTPYPLLSVCLCCLGNPFWWLSVVLWIHALSTSRSNYNTCGGKEKRNRYSDIQRESVALRRIWVSRVENPSSPRNSCHNPEESYFAWSAWIN